MQPAPHRAGRMGLETRPRDWASRPRPHVAHTARSTPIPPVRRLANQTMRRTYRAIDTDPGTIPHPALRPPQRSVKTPSLRTSPAPQRPQRSDVHDRATPATPSRPAPAAHTSHQPPPPQASEATHPTRARRFRRPARKATRSARRRGFAPPSTLRARLTPQDGESGALGALARWRRCGQKPARPRPRRRRRRAVRDSARRGPCRTPARTRPGS